MNPTGALLCSYEQHQFSTRTKYIHPISVQIPFKITSPLCLHLSSSLFHSDFITKALYAHQLQTMIKWHNLPTYDVTQLHPYNCLNTWSTRESDTEIWSTQMAYMFFSPQQCALHKIALLTFKSIWHPMKQPLSGLHIKIPGYTGVSTLPPYTLPQSCTTHWQSSRCTIHDMYLPPNIGHFFFVKIFISSSDSWILTFGE
jgi:hypothetical protein